MQKVVSNSLPIAKKIRLYILITVTTIGIFILDYKIPLGVAWGVPYVFAVFISLQLNNTRAVIVVVLLCVSLTILGYFLSPHGGILWVVWANRFIAVMAISLIGYLGIRMKKSEREIKKIADMPAENSNPVLRISQEYKILYANQQACLLFNCNENETSDHSLPKSWKEAIQHVVKNENSTSVEYNTEGRVLTFTFTFVPDRQYINIYGTDISELIRTQKELEKLSEIDALTGLKNRRVFNKSIGMEWQRAKRFKSTLSLLILDVDYFKKYNDEYGHPSGDKALQKVAKVLMQISNRPGDLVARYGGEEFVVLLPATDNEGAMVFAETIREKVEKKKIKHRKSDVSEHVTVSIGVASAKPAKNNKSKDLIHIADKALYQAKAQGRNCVVS